MPRSVARFDFWFTIIVLVLALKSTNCNATEVSDPEPSAPPFWEVITLYGVDSDKDGVRDDVEIWVNEKCKDQNMRQALKKLAISYRDLIKASNDKERYLEEKVKYNLRNYCWDFVTLNLKENHYVLLTAFHEKVLNTPLRSYYFKSGFSNLEGGVVSAPDVMPHLYGVACEFTIQNPRKIITEYLAKTPRYDWGEKHRKEFEEVYEQKSVVIDPYILFKQNRRPL